MKYLQITRLIVLFLSIIASASCKDNVADVKPATKKASNDVPGSVDSRFFDLGSLFNQMFPGFNQGTQGGYTSNPGAISYPGNFQSNPSAVPQGQIPNTQGNGWPIIDDAKQYPSQGRNPGNYQAQLPNQGNFGGSQQYPNQGNYGGAQQVQYPNQGNFGGSQQMQYPGQVNSGGVQQYPAQGNFGRPQQVQYPNQGNFGNGLQNQYPGQGNFGGSQQSQYPNQGNYGVQQAQNPNQGTNFGGSQQSQYPNQGNFGVQQTQNPNQGTVGNLPQMQYPNQGGFTNQGNQNGFGTGSGDTDEGTLDGILSKPSLPDRPNQNQQSSNRPAAILGNPVLVPTTTTPSGQLIFPDNRTDSPSQKQCVQDCSTTSEYNPLCGSDNVTYFNPGRFICARNCGINVFVSREGKCNLNSPL